MTTRTRMLTGIAALTALAHRFVACSTMGMFANSRRIRSVLTC